MTKIKIINRFLLLIVTFIFTNFCYADITFKDFENKSVPYLDFFLLKFESRLFSRSIILKSQMWATRIQYSNIGITVNFDKKDNKISININAIMDKRRYKKKKYEQKLSDCNQVRNLIFYKKHGYTFLRQKRDPSLSTNIMKETFKEVFFNNLSFSDKEIEFLMDNMFVQILVYHPIYKTELVCAGKVNDYELK